jgi:hypothetical protein
MPKEGMGAFAALRPSPGEQKNNAQSRHCERQRSNPGREKSWIASGLCQTATADRSSQALLAMTTMTMLPPPPSCPRRRASSIPRRRRWNRELAAYWIPAGALSSGAHSRDPVARV